MEQTPSGIFGFARRVLGALIGGKLFGSGFSMRRRERKMRLCETLSLGERRFLALVLVEQQKFLVGGAGNSIALLAQLPSNQAHISQIDIKVDPAAYKKA